jgi:hypothetical protein
LSGLLTAIPNFYGNLNFNGMIFVLVGVNSNC